MAHAPLMYVCACVCVCVHARDDNCRQINSCVSRCGAIISGERETLDEFRSMHDHSYKYVNMRPRARAHSAVPGIRIAI